MTRARVLVIEDDNAIQEVVAMQLKGRYELLFANSKAEALVMLEQPLDGVLLDMRLPEERGAMEAYDEVGVEILDEIRGRALTRKGTQVPLPVVVMTAYGDTYQVPVNLLVRHGANDYVAKPFAEEELVEKLERAFEGVNALLPPATGPGSGQLRVAFCARQQCVYVETLPPIKGASYQLLDLLRPLFEEDLAKRLAAAHFRGMRAGELAHALGIEESTVRRRVTRLRKRLAKESKACLGREIGKAHLLENMRDWLGYRLNPRYVRLLDPEEMPARG